MTDARRLAATLAFWSAFAAIECFVLVPLARALEGQGEGAALTLVVAVVGALVAGAIFAVPTYNSMMKNLETKR